jgi:hypothetical protein
MPSGNNVNVAGSMSLDHNGNLVIPIVHDSGTANSKVYLSTWNGQTWSKINTEISWYTKFLFDSDGDIYFAGDFTHLGGKLRPYFGKWMTKFGEAK